MCIIFLGNFLCCSDTLSNNVADSDNFCLDLNHTFKSSGSGKGSHSKTFFKITEYSSISTFTVHYDFSTKKGKNMPILLASDPEVDPEADPVPIVRILI
jgi:hypothetical protein